MFGSKKSSTNTTNNYDESLTQKRVEGDGNLDIGRDYTDSSSSHLMTGGIDASNSDSSTTAISRSNVTQNNQKMTTINLLDQGAIASSQQLAEKAVLSGVDMLDLTIDGVMRAGDNSAEVARMAVDFASGSNEQLLGAGAKLYTDFAGMTSDMYDRGVSEVSAISAGANRLAERMAETAIFETGNAYDRGFDGVSDAYRSAFDGTEKAYDKSLEFGRSSVNSISDAYQTANDSILSLSRQNSDEISKAYDLASERADNAIRESNYNAFSALGSLFNESNAQIKQTTGAAFEMVADTLKSDGEKSNETMLKFGGLAMAAVAAVFIFGR